MTKKAAIIGIFVCIILFATNCTLRFMYKDKEATINLQTKIEKEQKNEK